MGCAESHDIRKTGEHREHKRQTDELKLLLKKEIEKKKDVHKILLLGAGGCGKSTIMKQMKYINKTEFSREEMQEFTEIVRENLLSSVQNICRAALQEFAYGPLLDKETLALANFFTSLSWNLIQKFCREGLPDAPIDSKEIVLENKEDKEESKDEGKIFERNPSKEAENICLNDMAERIHKVLQHKKMKEALSRGSEYSLLDSAEYYIFETGPKKILAQDYVPSTDEIVRSRRATVAITEYRFKSSKDAEIILVDVGGQRDRRKKWIRCFENATMILFVASLADYDLKLEEDSTRNRMYESLDLYAGVAEMPWFAETPIVLFLNKEDIFKKKLKQTPFESEDYNGDKNDPEQVSQYIKDTYVGDDPDDLSFVFKTVAVAKDNIEKVWMTVEEIVFKNAMKTYGMIVS